MFYQWLQRPSFTIGFFKNYYYYFLMSSVPRSPQPELHRHGAGHFPTFSHVSHAWCPMGFSKLDFQKQLRSLFQWFFECLASHAWKKPGCQQQACSAFHKSDGHTDIILELIHVLKNDWGGSEPFQAALRPSEVFLNLWQSASMAGQYPVWNAEQLIKNYRVIPSLHQGKCLHLTHHPEQGLEQAGEV